MSGFVYVVRNETSGLLKIGYTNDPSRRLTMLRTSSPDPLTLLGTVAGTTEDEKALHDLLGRWRVAREWFAPCRALEPLLTALTPPPAKGRTMRRNGNPIREYRLDMGMQQKTLADLLDVSQGDVSRWESGERAIPILKCSAVSKATGIPREVLRPDVFASEAA